jgi:hypothetical protein
LARLSSAIFERAFSEKSVYILLIKCYDYERMMSGLLLRGAAHFFGVEPYIPAPVQVRF